MDNLDPVAFQNIRLPDARKLQQLRRVDCARTQNDFAARLGSENFALAAVAHARCHTIFD